MAEYTKQTINSFVGGLNFDMDASNMPSNSYRDAMNVRVTASTTNSASTLQPYSGFVNDTSHGGGSDSREYTVISTTSVRDLLLLFKVVKDLYSDSYVFQLSVYNTTTDSTINIFNNISHPYTPNSKFSIVTRYEDDDNIKVYWADGVGQIKVVNIAETSLAYNHSITDVDQLNIKPLMVMNKPSFARFGSGNLKNGKIQYAYFLYNKNGQQTEISVLSDMIPLTQSNDTQADAAIFKGGSSDKSSGKSVTIKIPISSDNFYSRMKVISLYYANNQDTPIIKIIADTKVEQNIEDKLFTDFGTNVIGELTLDEFNLLTGITFSPKYLEVKKNYLFAGNVTNIDWDVEYDARTFRSNDSGYTLIKSANGDSLSCETQSSPNILNPILSELSDTHDCINPYNDLNKPYDYYKNRNNLSRNQITNNITIGSQRDVEDTDKFAYLYQYDSSGNLKNVKYGGIGKNIKYEFIWTDVALEDSSMPSTSLPANPSLMLNSMVVNQGNTIPVNGKHSFEGMWHFDQDSNIIHSKHIDGGVDLSNRVCNYANTYIDLKYRSLQRDEIYRYGIVFYNKYGVKSTVKWIGDIRTPHILDNDIVSDGVVGGQTTNRFNFNYFTNNDIISFSSDGTSEKIGVKGKPLGIRFTIGNIPMDGEITAYEIVRVTRTITDKATVSQGYISKVYDDGKDTAYPFTIPTFSRLGKLLNSSDVQLDAYVQKTLKLFDSGAESHKYSDINYDHTKSIKGILQFVSPDTAFSNESFVEAISSSTTYNSAISLLHSPVLDNSTGSLTLSSYPTMWGITTDDMKYVKAISYPNTLEAMEYGGDASNSVRMFCFVNTDENKPRLQLVNYYTQSSSALYNTGDTNIGTLEFIGTNSSNNTRHVKSTDLSWNDKLNVAANMTNVGIFPLVNWCYDPNIYLSSGELAGSTQGPCVPSIYLAEQENSTTRFSDRLLNIKHATISQNRQALTTTYNTGGSLIGNSIGNSFYNIYNVYKKYTNVVFNIRSTPMDQLTAIVLINLRRITTPYGGETYASRQYSTYTSIGAISNISDTIYPEYKQADTVVLDTFYGDTYIGIFDHMRCHASYSPVMNDVAYNERTALLIRIPVETSFNLALTHGPEITKGGNFNAQIKASDVYGKYIQTDNLYLYNSAYSAISNATVHVPKNELDEFNNTNDVRIRFSEEKLDNELQDSWAMFKINNYLDLENKYGELTNLKLFKNQLLAFQQNAIAWLSVNERTVVNDDNVSGLVLGTGGVLDRYDYITTNYGIGPNNPTSLVDTESALYWYDVYRNELLMYSGQVIPLSKKKQIQSYLNANENSIKQSPIIFQNKETNEVYFNMFNTELKKTIVYSEQIDAFSTFIPSDFISGNVINGKLWITKDDSNINLNSDLDSIRKYTIAKYNASSINDFINSEYYYSYIQYVVNPEYDSTKIFDSVEFNGVYSGDETKIWYETDDKTTYTINSSDIGNRELTYKYAIPRIISGEDIPDRNRGNYTMCTFLTNPKTNGFKIPYFKTKYRTSKS